MKYLFGFLFLCVAANAAFLPTTTIIDPNTQTPANVTNNGELKVLQTSPLPVVVQSPVTIANFPSPIPTTTVTGTVNAVVASPLPVVVVSPIPSQTVNVANFPAPVPTQTVEVAGPNPLPVHEVSPVPVVFPSTLPVTIISPSPLPISGEVSVSNFPTPVPTQTVTGTVNAVVASPLPVDVENFPASTPVTQLTNPWTVNGTVTANAGSGVFTVGQSVGSNLHTDVDNFPATQAVTQSTNPWTIAGSVSINNFPSPVPTQLVEVVGPSPLPVSVPTPLPIQGGNSLPVTVNGTVMADVPNPLPISAPSPIPVVLISPSPLPVSGTVAVSNFPTPVPTQTVFVVGPSPLPVIEVSPAPVVFPSVLPVVIVSPSPLQILGTVDVDNFPTPVPTQTVTGTVNAIVASPLPVVVVSPIPSQTVTVSNFPTPSPTITVQIAGPSPLPVIGAATVPNASPIPSPSYVVLMGGQNASGNAQILQTDGSSNGLIVVDYGHAVLSTFTQSYSSSNLLTSAFTTIISSTGSNINWIDIFDSSGLDYYVAYAATCGALSNSSNAIIVSAGGGGKGFFIPSGNCVGFEAKTSTINSGSVNMTFYK